MQQTIEDLGKGAKGLSPNHIVRLKKVWEKEYQEWAGKRFVWKENCVCLGRWNLFQVKLGEDRPCLFVRIGALEDRRKELIGIYDGQRESKLSWAEVLSDLKRRGLKTAPQLAIGEGALGFWLALEQGFSLDKNATLLGSQDSNRLKFDPLYEQSCPRRRKLNEKEKLAKV